MKRMLLISLFAVTAPWAAQLPVFHTSGRFLLDPCGDMVVMRGVELPVNYLEYIPEVAKTGANFVRVLMNTPPQSNPIPATELDAILALVKQSGMAADVSLFNGVMDGTAYVDPTYMPVLKKYEDIITLHAQGEGGQATAALWVSDAKSIITRIRNAGFRCPLFILSTSSGRNPFTVLRNGQQLVDFDPQHNILCGVQLYWGYTSAGAPGWYINDYKMTDKQGIDSFAVQNFPIVAGINNHDPYGDPWLDYETQLSECQAKKISWFWWDWNNPWSPDKYHLSLTGKYGDWGVLAAGCPDMDKFTISGGGASTVTYEGENASSLAGTGWGKMSTTTIPSGQFLCCSGKRIPDWGEWNQIAGGSGGQRTLTVTYSNGDEHFNQPLKVVLNGDTVATLTCGHSGPGASAANFYRVWKDESTTINLRSGTNTIRLVSTATSGYFNPNYGEKTCISHPASIKNTSKRTRYMLNHSCSATPVVESISPVWKSHENLFMTNGTFAFVVTNPAGRVVVRSGVVDRKGATALLQRLHVGVYAVRRIGTAHQGEAMAIFR